MKSLHTTDESFAGSTVTAEPPARPSSLATLAHAGVRKTRQFRISVAQWGLKQTLYWAAFGCLRPNRFLIFEHFPGRDTARRPVPGVVYEIWDARRLAAWRKRHEGLRPEFFRDEIDGVRLCAVALMDGNVAGFIWIYREDDTSRLFGLQPNEAELNHGTVLEEHRGKGLFWSVLSFASSWLTSQGYDRVYAGVHSLNTPSMAAFQRAGFRAIGTVLHFGPYRPQYQPQSKPR